MLAVLTHGLLAMVTETQAPPSSKGFALPILNAQRQLHCDTPDLLWDYSLAGKARQYAQTCPNTTDPSLAHTDIGESIAFIGAASLMGVTESTQAWTNAITQWYGQSLTYDYANGTVASGEVMGDFARIAWDQTTRVGCAYNAQAVPCDNIYPNMWNSVFVCRFIRGAYGVEPRQFVDHIHPLVSSGACDTKADPVKKESRQHTLQTN